MKGLLMYHSIDESGSPVSLDRRTFRRHVTWLAASGVRVVRAGDLVSVPAAADAVALTFDDAFENFLTEAWPVLRDHGLDVSLFVPTDHVGGENAWEDGRRIPRQRLLDWGALAQLASEGVELGAHTRTHPRLPELDDAALESEIEGSAERLEVETGRRPSLFAYPYGAFDDRAVRVVRDGFDAALTTELRAVSDADDRHRLPRIDAFYLRRPGRLETWGTTSFRRYLMLRRRLRSARRLVSKGVRL